MAEIHFLPCPLKGRCPECGAKHGAGEPHDVMSAYYNMRKRRKEKHGVDQDK